MGTASGILTSSGISLHADEVRRTRGALTYAGRMAVLYIGTYDIVDPEQFKKIHRS